MKLYFIGNFLFFNIIIIEKVLNLTLASKLSLRGMFDKILNTIKFNRQFIMRNELSMFPLMYFSKGKKTIQLLVLQWQRKSKWPDTVICSGANTRKCISFAKKPITSKHVTKHLRISSHNEIEKASLNRDQYSSDNFFKTFLLWGSASIPNTLLL